MSTEECRLCYPGECTPLSHSAAEAAEVEEETCKTCGATPGSACDPFEHRAAIALDATMRRARMTAAAWGNRKDPAAEGSRLPPRRPVIDAGGFGHAPLTMKEIAKLRELLGALEDALKHKHSFRWGEGVRVRWTKLLQRAGVVLMTKTALARHGLEPKRGAKPVGTGYFGAPLQVHAELFVLGVQTRPRASESKPPVLRDGEASAGENRRRRGPHGA